MKKLIFLFLAVVICLSAGCSKAGKSKTTIAVIPKGTTHEFWKSIHAGALKAARENGVEIIWKGPQKEDDRTQQILAALVGGFDRSPRVLVVGEDAHPGEPGTDGGQEPLLALGRALDAFLDPDQDQPAPPPHQAADALGGQDPAFVVVGRHERNNLAGFYA